MIQKVSICPFSNTEYVLPNSLDDSLAIEAFLLRNVGRKVVVVQGLGFVGAVMALVACNAIAGDYAVIGVDLATESSYWKIASINSGKFPVQAEDPKIEQFFENALEQGNLLATFDPRVFGNADVIVVDINLDVQKRSSNTQELLGFEVDMEPFSNAIRAIGAHCQPDCLVLVETTVPPGTCEKIVSPLLRNCLIARELPDDQIKIGHSYERVMPGPKYIDSIQNFYRVFSGVDEKSKRATEQFLRSIIRTDEYPLTELDSTSATEMSKVLENSYRAMNIGFIVEWSRFAEEAGVNLFEVVNAIRMRPTHKNIMLPGLGVGGYCLTKDPLLASWARVNLFDSNESLVQSVNAVATNDLMPRYAFEFLKKQFTGKFSGAKVLLLGVSYLNDVGDTRYTPVEPFYRLLVQEGAVVKLHDPYIKYWAEVDQRILNDFENLVKDDFEIVVITTGHSIYRNKLSFFKNLCRTSETLLYDTIGIFNNEELEQLRTICNVRVLGRGDIQDDCQ